MADETTALWMQAFSWLGLGYVIYRAFFVDNGPTFEDDPSPSRNHLLRLTTAAFYVPFVIVSAVYVPNVIHIFMTIMVTKGLGEFIECLIPARASKEEGAKKKYKFSRMDRLVQLLGGLQVVLCHFLSELGLSLGLALAFVIILCFFLFKTVQEGHNPLPPNTVRNLAFYLFGWVWIAWTISHCPAIYHTSPYGGSMLAMLLLTGWIGDGAAYYVGKNFGRHKAMPNVSPNKSWEGIVAEIVFAVLLCYGFKQLQLSGITDKLPPYDTIHYIGLALLTSCLGIFGDAIESLVKRMGNIKDSGVFFPGHGGILDRFDAFFVSGPFIYHYLIHVVGAGHLKMLDQELRLLKERLLRPLVGRIARLGLTPNQLTLISFALGILAGHFCLEGRLNAALVLWWLNRVVDGVDGAVARHLHRQTDFGGYLDIICDFIVYTTIPIDLAFFQVTSACSIDVPSSQGCGFKAADGTSWGPLFWLLASLSFLLGTYFINAASLFMLGGILEKRNLGAQTRGEKTTLTMPVGLIEGTETIIFYSLFIALPQHLTALFVLFGSLVAVTILQRLGWAYRHLDN